MEKMLIVVFDEEKKAYEGSGALQQLDAEGSITIHAESVIQKNTDGTISVKQTEGDFPIRTLGGTAIGSLIGLLGGPIGLAIGATAGTVAGMIADVDVAGVDATFLDDTSATLKPGKYAVVADISEEWVTPVDTRMEALGGVVFRATRRSVEIDQTARAEAELRAEIEALKAEQAQARAEHKAKLQARIDRINSKLQSNLEQAKRRSEEMRRETEAKLQALEQKAAKAQGDAKAALNARVAQLREQHERAQVKARTAVAGQLRKAADQVEKKAAV
jgi:uncharacterized membrane protein